MASFFRTVARLWALAIAFLPALLGIEQLLAGNVVVGATLLAFAVAIFLIQEYAVTPDEIPGKISASAKRRASGAKRRLSWGRKEE